MEKSESGLVDLRRESNISFAVMLRVTYLFYLADYDLIWPKKMMFRCMWFL